MLFLKEDDLLMIQSAGFEPCHVSDFIEGDTIMIDHAVNRDYENPGRREMPTEMVVTNLQETPVFHNSYATGVMRRWIGVLTRNGLKVHCGYHGGFECWKLTELGRVARESDPS